MDLFHGLPDFTSSPPKEVGPTQNQETMTLHFLTTLDLIVAYYVEGPHEEDGIEIAFG